MALPGNGIFVVRGEMSTLMTAMRRGARWSSTSYQEEEQDGLMKQFIDLKQILSKIEDLRLIDPNIFLGPFLEVIRTEETTGAVTSLALSAVNKFLSYGLIDPTHSTLAATVENIADAVTHARFMGTDQASDGVTLMRVVEVLHTLIRSPEGSALTNESVCEVMLSCFKICFEPRLNELLRRTAEQALKDMVLLLFMRLPQFFDDRNSAGLFKKFKMIAGPMEQNTKRRKSKNAGKQHHNLKNTTTSTTVKPTIPRINTIKTEEQVPIVTNVTQDDVEDAQSPKQNLFLQTIKVPPLATTPATPAGNILDMQGKITQTPTTSLETNIEEQIDVGSGQVIADESCQKDEETTELLEEQETDGDKYVKENEDSEYINSVGVRFTQQNSTEIDGTNITLVPYGLPCLQELFRFLILLCNPLDKQNTDTMMHMGLSLLTVALEVSADNIGKYDTLLALVKDELCRNLFSLLQSERLTIFAADLQVCFLLFESLRTHLKFQLEAYLMKLSEIIASENPRTPYEMRELALDNLLQLWRIPGFVAELYINYDCDLYSSDLFENLTKLLSKNTLSATQAVYSTHILSLDALISVIENIERNCILAKSGNSITTLTSNRHSRHNSELQGITIDNMSGTNNINCELINSGDESDNLVLENISNYIKRPERHFVLGINAPKLSKDELNEIKNKKRILTQGTEVFNQRPEKGIQYLQENGILNSILDPMEIALFLRSNSGLDKKMIGEYVSKKKNVESKILRNFVESFDFNNIRIDQALRLYLESFRLPGEAPLIFLVMEHFAEHWSAQNNEPFVNTDAAFRLAYAIIMLNMDQHNHNAKRLNVPMTPEDFCKNLRGLNGNKDFDQEMLLNIFNSIKNEEIIMPAEQTGAVRENYLWKMLLRRSTGKNGPYQHVSDSTFDKDLFNIVWGSALTALSFMFDKSNENGYQKTLLGFSKCAGISAFYNLHEDFDAVILTLCKFSTLLSIQPESNEINVAVQFGLNQKAQSATKSVFTLVHEYGDCLREGWKNILEIIIQLFRLKILPKTLIEVEDFCEQNGKATLILEKPSQKPEAGLFSSLYSYLSSEGQREPSYEEQEIIKLSKKCIRECQVDQIIQGSKFIQYESLQELLKVLLTLVKPPNAHKSVGLPYSEDIVTFWMEFLVKIVIQNRDRMLPLWNSVRDQIYLLLIGSSSCGYEYLLNRTTVALLKLAIYLMRNEELCPIILQSLKMLLMLKPNVIFRISKQISNGIYELLKTSAQNIHTEADWQIIFTTLECVGAGTLPPEYEDSGCLPLSTKSDGAMSSEDDSGLPDRGYISDSEILNSTLKDTTSSQQKAVCNNPQQQHPSACNENWIIVSKDSGEVSVTSIPQSPLHGNSLVYPCKLIDQMPFALFKCWDSLAFIVRNVAHITPYNFESCVRCIRTFVEACLDGGIKMRKKYAAGKMMRKKTIKKDGQRNRRRGNDDNQSSDSDDEDLNQRFETLSIQLLDLMYTLYTRTAQIFRWWAEEGCAVPQCSALWAQGWCPLLQGIARFAMDRRREVRTYAISCLQQRALLVHDLQTLTGAEWASCFKQVLFPLLNELLPDSLSIGKIDPVLLEESRIRTATIMSKVFLHHLTPLIELSTFNDLWLEILDYIEKFMKVGSDMLSEQMLEILKNMLLVMHSVKVFHHQIDNNENSGHSPLWELTWKRIGEFLPNLKDEIFKEDVNRNKVVQKLPQNQHESLTIMPAVAILPNSPQTVNQHSAAELVINGYTGSEILPSPKKHSDLDNTVNSSGNLIMNTGTKSSIILQPPVDILSVAGQPVILGQNSPQHVTVPVLIPNAPINQPPISASQSDYENSSPPISYSLKNDLTMASTLPDLISNAPNLIHTPTESSTETSPKKENQIYQQQQKSNDINYSEFAIDLPETPPSQNDTMMNQIYTNQNLEDHVNQQYQQQQQQYQQEQQQKMYQQYQQLYQQQQFVQQQLQNQQFHPNQKEINDVPNNPTESQIVENPILIQNEEPRVPISHLLSGNQYPSYNKSKDPPNAIVQSFAPVFVQSQNPQIGTEIYSDYMNDPYNLTLQQQSPLTSSTGQINDKNNENLNTNLSEQQILGASNMFQYFGGHVDPSTIPPGSEMLFGQP